MGITSSKMNSKKEKDESMSVPEDTPLEESIDFIATHYILTLNFQSLRKLNEKSYCDKMMVLTSDILQQKFTHLEVNRLKERVEKGTTEKGTTEKGTAREKEQPIPPSIPTPTSEEVFFLNKDDYSSKPAHKTESCNQIAKFYIKIAHLFSAIVMTINPEYSYKDFFGNVIKYSLFQKDLIPKNADIQLHKLNLCSNRVNALVGKNNVDELSNLGTDEKSIKIQPEVCSIHVKKDGKIKTLEDEPGIPELMELYYDSDYDYKTGEFKGMSKETQQQFQTDLIRFYQEFTGKGEMPESIKRFSDIKLREYGKMKICVNGATDSFKGNYKDELFNEYARNVNQMIHSVNEKQEELLKIIQEIFVVSSTTVRDASTKEELVRIQPTLTEERLQSIIEMTRRLIINMYLKCEKDFVHGVKIYEAIVEAKILETTQNQINLLEKESEKLYSRSY